jgi:hypothetical protein
MREGESKANYNEIFSLSFLFFSFFFLFSDNILEGDYINKYNIYICIKERKQDSTQANTHQRG